MIFDTSAFYALISKIDIFHKQVKQIYIDILRKEISLYTTSYILLETIALVHKRLGWNILSQFVQQIMNKFSIIWMNENRYNKAWELLKEKHDKLSFVDCSTLVIAEDINLNLIFIFQITHPKRVS